MQSPISSTVTATSYSFADRRRETAATEHRKGNLARSVQTGFGGQLHDVASETGGPDLWLS
jgi:hypothetical protein